MHKYDKNTGRKSCFVGQLRWCAESKTPSESKMIYKIKTEVKDKDVFMLGKTGELVCGKSRRDG